MTQFIAAGRAMLAMGISVIRPSKYLSPWHWKVLRICGLDGRKLAALLALRGRLRLSPAQDYYAFGCADAVSFTWRLYSTCACRSCSGRALLSRYDLWGPVRVNKRHSQLYIPCSRLQRVLDRRHEHSAPLTAELLL